MPGVIADPDADLWRATEGSGDPQAFLDYLARFPSGRHAEAAQQRARQLLLEIEAAERARRQVIFTYSAWATPAAAPAPAAASAPAAAPKPQPKAVPAAPAAVAAAAVQSRSPAAPARKHGQGARWPAVVLSIVAGAGLAAGAAWLATSRPPLPGTQLRMEKALRQEPLVERPAQSRRSAEQAAAVNVPQTSPKPDAAATTASEVPTVTAKTPTPVVSEASVEKRPARQRTASAKAPDKAVVAAAERAAAAKAASEKAAAEKAAAEKAAAEKLTSLRPAPEKPITEKPVTEKPIAEKPAPQAPIAEKPPARQTAAASAPEKPAPQVPAVAPVQLPPTIGESPQDAWRRALSTTQTSGSSVESPGSDRPASK